MARNIYKNEKGKRVPSVTTILGLLNKPALVYWANKMGLNGINTRDYVDDKADIGTLAHKMVENYCNGKVVEYLDYEFEQVETAQIAFNKWLDYIKDKEFDPIENELMMVHEELSYGGQIDIYANLEGKKTLIDIKTCNGIYFEQYIQLSAYYMLLKEKGYEVDRAMIVRIGRDEEEGFEVKEITIDEMNILFEIFKSLLTVYNTKKNKLIKHLVR